MFIMAREAFLKQLKKTTTQATPKMTDTEAIILFLNTTAR